MNRDSHPPASRAGRRRAAAALALSMVLCAWGDDRAEEAALRARLAADGRLDPAARLLAEREALGPAGPWPAPDGAGRRGWFVAAPPDWNPPPPLAERVRWGGGARPWLLDLAPAELAALLDDPALRHVAAEGRLRPCLDLALPVTGTDLVHAGAAGLDRAHRGAGVLVGVVDSGIDPGHGDFWAADRCRILRLWDQVDGGVFTREALESGQAGNRDPDGHGTHVAGIAAGNGAAAPGGPGGGPFVGHAPAAELLVVRSTLAEGDILRAAEWVFDTARELGRPCVLNLSLETHLGAHDGGSLLEDGLEALAGPGRLIVCAAGNTADAGRHASAAYNSAARLDFTSEAGEGLFADLWVDSPDAPQLRLLMPDGSRRAAGPGGQQAGWYVQLAVPVAERGRWHSLLRLEGGSAGQAFALELAHAGPGFRSCHAWAEGLRFTDPDPTRTLGIPATGDSMLVAGSLLHRLAWTDEAGHRWQYSQGVEGEASPFSAQGPRVDGRELPQALLPGQGVFAAMSRGLADDPAQAMWRHADGAHILRQGTSMAAPALAGLMALALEREPQLGCRAADSLLRAAGGETWSPARGCGPPRAPLLLAWLGGGLADLAARPGLDEVELTWTLGRAWEGGRQRLWRLQDDGEEPAWEGASTAGSWTVRAAATRSPLSFLLTLEDGDGRLVDSLATPALRLLEASRPRLLGLWPNPAAGGRLTLDLVSPAAQFQSWRLCNARGQRVAGGLLELPRGRATRPFILPGGLAAGRYWLSLGPEEEAWPLTVLP